MTDREAIDPRCPVCGAAGAPHERRDRGGGGGGGGAWTRFSCGACELEYWSPREIDPGFYSGAHHDTYERRRRGEAFLRERHHVFLRRATPGRLLDVGCGEGMFLQVARERGFEIAGLDLDAGNVASARARGLAPIEQGLVVDAEGQLAPMLRGARPFDWVTAFEVLEHQPDPLGFLRAARSQLAPGGRLCGSVPNRDRIFASRERARSDGDFPPHHFLWFSQRALAATLRAAGFSRVVVEPIAERDPQALAAFLEHALLGGLTGAGKRVVRRAAEGGGQRGRARGLLQAARRLKNAPFVPAARLVARLAPDRARGLYFEAA